MAELDEVLALEWDAAPPAPAGGVATARGHLGEEWLIGHAINGGVLMALGLGAAAEGLTASGHTAPLSWSAHFLSAAVVGPVEVAAEVLRAGRSVSTAHVRVVQEDGAGPVERVRLVGTFGDVARLDPVHRAPAPPAVPGPAECLPATREASPAAAAITMLDRLDLRVDPSTAGFAVGQPTRRGVIRAWLRMRDGREPDVRMLPYAVDALMPVSFDLGVPGWAPTLELTGQVLGDPAPGWLLVELSTDTVVGDLLVEDCRLWDSTGRLVARSRQLAGVRMPPT
ncbi:MAG TPA: thioesterase family protein [Ornithinibacter sp.]|nr:thioesterase family protein [Ornithinibacter sp.]